jgi:hypothetical protein
MPMQNLLLTHAILEIAAVVAAMEAVGVEEAVAEESLQKARPL